MVDRVANSLARLAPVTLWADEGKAGFAVNRRNNMEAEVPDIPARGQAPRGPVDHSVPVLAVKCSDGWLKAIVFGLPAMRWAGDLEDRITAAVDKVVAAVSEL